MRHDTFSGPENSNGPLERSFATPDFGLRIGLVDIWTIVKRNLVLILATVALTTVAGYLIVSSLDKEYTARATIVLSLSDTRLNMTDGVLETNDMTRAQVETQIDELVSREFARAVAERLDLIAHPAFNPFLASEAGQTATVQDQYAAVITRLLNSYHINRDGESLALDITVNHTDPILTAQIANTLASEYIKQTLTVKQDAVLASVSFLRTRVEQLSEQLTDAEIKVADFIRANQLDDKERSDELRAELIRGESIRNLSAQQGADAGNLRELDAELALLEEELKERTRAELTLINMERALDTERTRYQAFVERLNELEAQVNVLQPAARQISFAETPKQPSWPSVNTATAGSLSVGVVLGLFGALLRETLDRRVWSGPISERATGQPNLAYVPRIRERRLDRPNVLSGFLVGKPRSAYNEAMRGLLTAIGRRQKHGDCAFVMVASGLPNEGKSTIALSLAVSAASEGQRVLLIDLDLHRRGLSRLLDVELSEISPIEALSDLSVAQSAIREDVILDNIDFLNFKSGTIVPMKLATDPRYKETLAYLRQNYDLVVLDTPPILVTESANRLGEITDMAILVSRWGRTTEDTITNASELMMLNRIPLVGTVLNDVDLTKHNRYGYGGTGSYYSYDRSYSD